MTTELRRLGDMLRKDLPTLVLSGLLLYVVASMVRAGEWVDGLIVLPVVMVIAMVTGYLLAISDLNELFVLLVTGVYGWATVWVLVGQLLPGELTLRSRILWLDYRLWEWLQRAVGGGFSRDNIIFLLLVAVLAWLLTFNMMWNLFRTRRLWLALIPPGIALLINAYNFVGALPAELYVLVYLFLTFLLAVSTNAFNREQLWLSRGVSFSDRTRRDLMRGGVIAILMLLMLTWFAPTASANDRLVSLWESPDNPWLDMRDTFTRVFNAVEGPAASTPTYYAGSTVAMGGPIFLSDDPVMTVYAPAGHRYYWQSKVFDTYLDGRWLAMPDDRDESEYGILANERSGVYRLRQNIQQEFELSMEATQILYAAPQPFSFSSLPLYYEVIYTSPGEDYATITSARARNVLTRGQSYGATSSVSIADEASLRRAEQLYPKWVTDTYLGLPDSISQRTIDLAASLTADQPTVYDKARAVESYLRDTITYNEKVDAPPADAEPVDYVLFDSQEGYCVYYASAMAVMLRSQGIPARLAVGFSQGEYDPETSSYTVLESDAHTWVQVYFTDYGWIDFEPTTARDPIVRPEMLTLDDLAPEQQPPPPGEQEAPQELEPEVLPTPDPALTDPTQAESGSRFQLNIDFTKVLRWIGGLAAVVLAVLAGLWGWQERHGLHNLSEVSGSYARLNVFARWLGVNLSPSDTPYERAQAYTDTIPESDSSVREIVGLYMQEQYSSTHLTEAEQEAGQQARSAWQRLQRVLLKAGVSQRIRRLNPFRGDVSIR